MKTPKITAAETLKLLCRGSIEHNSAAELCRICNAIKESK
jgi:hypothetical protein